MAVTRRDTLVQEERTGALSPKRIYKIKKTPAAPARLCSLWLHLRDLKEAGWCWRDVGAVVASGVGLAGGSPGDWTGVTEPRV